MNVYIHFHTTDTKLFKYMHILKQINAGINKKYHSELYITVKTHQQQSLRKILQQHMNISTSQESAHGRHPTTASDHTNILKITT